MLSLSLLPPHQRSSRLLPTEVKATASLGERKRRKGKERAIDVHLDRKNVTAC